MAAVGLGAWTLGRSFGNAGDRPQAENSDAHGPPRPSQPKVVKPERRVRLRPAGRPGRSIPSSPARDRRQAHTYWHTDNYNSADLGGLKDGVGLLLDMGKSVPIGDVVATLAERPAATVELEGRRLTPS